MRTRDFTVFLPSPGRGCYRGLGPSRRSLYDDHHHHYYHYHLTTFLPRPRNITIRISHRPPLRFINKMTRISRWTSGLLILRCISEKCKRNTRGLPKNDRCIRELTIRGKKGARERERYSRGLLLLFLFFHYTYVTLFR